MIYVIRKDELFHYGVSKRNGAPGRGSGRYALGSSNNSKNSKHTFEFDESKERFKLSDYLSGDYEYVDGEMVDKGKKAIEEQNLLDSLTYDESSGNLYVTNADGSHSIWLPKNEYAMVASNAATYGSKTDVHKIGEYRNSTYDLQLNDDGTYEPIDRMPIDDGVTDLYEREHKDE